MKVTSEFDEHLISVEDAQTGVLWHFASSKTKGFRFIGAQPAHQGDVAPDANSLGYMPAEAMAVDHARKQGWL